MKPHEFWALHPVEFWWTVDAKKPKKKYGSMNEDEVADLYDEMKGLGLIHG